MYNIEKEIINMLGYHESLTKIEDIELWLVIDSYDEVVGGIMMNQQDYIILELMLQEFG